MIQRSAGVQPDKQPPKGKDFLNDFLAKAGAEMAAKRNPSTFQQVANGAQPQTVDATLANILG